LAGQDESADQFIFLQHRHTEDLPPYTRDFDGCNGYRNPLFNVSRICRKIGDLNRSFGCQHTTSGGLWAGAKRRAAADFGEVTRCIMCSNEV
jgi:hypothetical protein